MQRRVGWLVLGVVAVGLVGGCGTPEGSEAAQDDGQDAPFEIRVAMASSSLGHATSLIAGEGEFFQKNGISASLVDAQSGTSAVASVLSGDVEVYSASPTSVFAAQQRGTLLMPIQQYSGLGSTVTLSTDAVSRSGISPESPVEDRIRALDGLKIASVDEGSSLTAELSTALKSIEGVEVDFVYMDQEAYLAALSSGAIDGYVGTAPYPQLAEIQGHGVTWLSGPRGEFPGYTDRYIFNSAGFTEDLARANPELAKRIIKTYADTAAYIDSNPDGARDLLIQALPDVDPEVITAFWETEQPALVQPVTTLEGATESLREYNSLSSASGSTRVFESDLKPLLAASLVAGSGAGR